MAESDGGPTVTMSVDASEVMSALKRLDRELDKPVPDRLAGAIADSAVEHYGESLKSEGSVITGTGLESIHSRHLGTGTYGVFMAGYLEQVDKGASPAERLPLQLDDRFRAAAEDYGMSVLTLQSVIKTDGTQPHPFKERALKRTREGVTDEIMTEVRRLLK